MLTATVHIHRITTIPVYDVTGATEEDLLRNALRQIEQTDLRDTDGLLYEIARYEVEFTDDEGGAVTFHDAGHINQLFEEKVDGALLAFQD